MDIVKRWKMREGGVEYYTYGDNDYEVISSNDEVVKYKRNGVEVWWWWNDNPMPEGDRAFIKDFFLRFCFKAEPRR